MVSSIFILDLKGKVVMCRHYKGDVTNSVIEKFINNVIDAEEDTFVTPIFFDNGLSFIHVRYEDLYCKRDKFNKRGR